MMDKVRSWVIAGCFVLVQTLVFGGQQVTSASAPAVAHGPAMAATAYCLEAGDTIEIRFFFNPELNDTVQIRPDGRISLQLGGEIELAGKTIAVAVQDIQTRFAQELKTPKVTLQVRSYGGRKVFVTGEVPRPGTISIPGGMSLIAAISDAGGIKTTGDRNKVILIRKGTDGAPLMKSISLRERGKVTAESFTNLQAYDVVIVPESHISRMDRWVDQYIKQLSPANMSAGFTYLYNTTSVLGLPLP